MGVPALGSPVPSPGAACVPCVPNSPDRDAAETTVDFSGDLLCRNSCSNKARLSTNSSEYFQSRMLEGAVQCKYFSWCSPFFLLTKINLLLGVFKTVI